MVKRARKDLDRLISNIETDIHGRQEIAYKLIKHLNEQQEDTARSHIIHKGL